MRQFKLYVDMDGLLTAWDDSIRLLGPGALKGLPDNAPSEDKQAMYDAIEAAGEPFWADMRWEPEGKKLWAWLKQFHPILLSSPGKFKYAESGKIQWVNKNIPGTQLFLSEDKWEYAERNSILIDDMQENIGSWEQRGGIGILYDGNAESTKEKVLNAIRSISPSRAEQAFIPDILRDISKAICSHSHFHRA